MTVKQVLRQKVDSVIGYEDWVVFFDKPHFDPNGVAYLPLRNVADGGVEWFTINEVAAMEVVGTTVD